jgi:predicted nucleic acid-binding protein
VGILIDASILIAYERGALDARTLAEKRIAGSEEDAFYVSVVTASELLHGVHRARDPARRARRSAFVEAVLSEFPMLDIGMTVARVHAELWAELAAAGTPIGAHDLWIAATAVSHGLALATANRPEFDRVPGLVVEDWAA